MQRNRTRLLAMAGALTVWLAAPAWGVDGVIEINQASVKAAGGFPFMITQTGSYRLTSNLDVTDATARHTAAENTTAIRVTASYVTIDLNGFSIQGPCVVPGGGAPCSPGGTGRGIDGSGVAQTTVKNGNVQGMGADGLLASVAENVHALGNHDDGIIAAKTTDCFASQNGSTGIAGTAVINSIASENHGDGISSPGSVANCVAFNNRGTGISTKTATGCTAFGNDGKGIVGTTATGCTAQFNATSPQIMTIGITGQNICDSPGSPCP